MTNAEKFKTVKERAEAFNNFCNNNECQKCFDDCLSHAVPCLLKWLDLGGEEEKPLPCPFCGEMSTLDVYFEFGAYAVSCGHCYYKTPRYESKKKAITAHNRVARAVGGEVGCDR